MTAEVRPEDGRTVVVAAGELDIATTPELDEAVASVPDGDIVIDLAGVSFMGSSGLASLLRAARHANEIGGTLTLRAPSRAVRDLLEMTQLTHRFTIVDG